MLTEELYPCEDRLIKIKSESKLKSLQFIEKFTGISFSYLIKVLCEMSDNINNNFAFLQYCQCLNINSKNY